MGVKVDFDGGNFDDTEIDKNAVFHRSVSNHGKDCMLKLMEMFNVRISQK